MADSLISPDQIHREVQKAIADALQISEQKVEPDSSLIRDLAAESLDFIDINFRLEQRFNVGMPRKYFLEHVEELFGEGTAIDSSGRLTETAVTIWNARLGSAAPPGASRLPRRHAPAPAVPRHAARAGDDRRGDSRHLPGQLSQLRQGRVEGRRRRPDHLRRMRRERPAPDRRGGG